jgi:hypothetical protein
VSTRCLGTDLPVLFYLSYSSAEKFPLAAFSAVSFLLCTTVLTPRPGKPMSIHLDRRIADEVVGVPVLLVAARNIIESMYYIGNQPDQLQGEAARQKRG